MKKKILLIALIGITFASCKKKEEVTESSNVDSNGYYKLGTVLESSSGDYRKSIAYKNENGKTSWAELPASGAILQEVALGDYSAGLEVARSKNGLYVMIYQTDGNLVLYKLAYANGPQSSALWSSRSVYSGASLATFSETSGFIALKATNGGFYWSSNVQSSPRPIWILQDDGNFVGYSNFSTPPTIIPQIVITGSAFASTGTAGGQRSGRQGKVK